MIFSRHNRVTLHKLRLVALALLSSGAIAQASSPDETAEWDYGALKSSDLVARGTVVAVVPGEVLSSDFWSEARRTEATERVGFVTISVEEVLRGPTVDGDFRFMVHRSPEEVRIVFSVGSEVLVALFYHPRLHVYYQALYSSRFFRSESEWLAGPTLLEERLFSDEELRQQLRETAIETVADDAELVVEGVIESVAESIISGADGSSARLVTITLVVENVGKGSLPKSPLQIVALTRGAYWPEWRKRVPKNYSTGQRWLCFLRHNEQGWYPFAGSNGLFQIVDGKLIYAERVEYWHTKASVDEIIKSARSEPDH